MAEIKKELDISEFMTFIRSKVRESPVLSHSGGRFYGNIKVYFKDGLICQIDWFETTK